uniref:Carboxylesterase type B domain-containing protein n=1 Tax=Panagrolaimus sp. JU765 TaxID=591449 RepID=A0AC34R7N4_9BILA
GGNAETMWAVSTRKAAAKNCQELAVKIGYKKKSGGTEWSREENQELLKWLKTLPSSKFEMTMVGSSTIFYKLRLEVGPVIDDDILPAPPSILREDAPTRPVLAGNTAHESLFILPLMMKSLNNKMIDQMQTVHEKFLKKYSKAFESESINLEDLKKAYVPLMMKSLNNKMIGQMEAVNEKFLKKYAKAYESESINFEDLKKAYGLTDLSIKDKKFRNKTIVLMMDDLVNNFALYNFAELERKKGSNVWIYYFDQHNPGITRMLHYFMPFEAATHATELAYLLDTNMYMMPFTKTANDKIVENIFTKLYTNFAKFGNPNGDPRYPANNILDITWEPVTDEYPEKHLRIL